MQSSWEKLTDGRCNNNLQPMSKKALTARQLKDQLRAALPYVERKFDRLAALDAMNTLEARKLKRKASDTWQNRQPKSTTGFYDPAAARATKRGAM